MSPPSLRVGMIAAYCHGDKIGVTVLQQNAAKGCLRSAYTLGLILRDCDKVQSARYLHSAIARNYLPAWQELLPSPKVKAKFGDLDSASLKSYFDPISLNKLLCRTYLQSTGVRSVSTSHCWNPCCGRWALKATQSSSRVPQLQFPSKYLTPMKPHLEASVLKLVEDGDKIEPWEDAGRSLRIVGGVRKIDNSCSSETNNMNSCQDRNDMPMTCTRRTEPERSFRVSRMKMCSSCRRAKYCSKLCQVYDWRSGQHKMECQYLQNHNHQH